MRSAGASARSASQACGPPPSASPTACSRALARHIIQRRSVAPAGADQKAVGAVGADEHLPSGQTQRSVLPPACVRGRKRIVAMRALLQRRNDQRRAGHHPFQHRMRCAALRERQPRSPQARSARRRGPAGLPSTRASSVRPRPRPPPRPERGCRATRVRPPAAAARREAPILRAKSARHLRPRRHDELGGAVAQQRLLRCQMQIHAYRACPSGREGSARGGPGRCAGFPMSRHRSSRAAIAGTRLRHPPRRNSSRSDFGGAWPPAASINRSLSACSSSDPKILITRIPAQGFARDW